MHVHVHLCRESPLQLLMTMLKITTTRHAHKTEEQTPKIICLFKSFSNKLKPLFGGERGVGGDWVGS